MAQEVILHLDKAQEFRQFSDVEFSLRVKLKKRILGGSSLRKLEISNAPEFPTSKRVTPTLDSST
jgi:hypothetical protein